MRDARPGLRSTPPTLIVRASNILYHCIKSYARVPEGPAQGEAMAVKGVLGVVVIPAAACSLDARLLLSSFFAPDGNSEVNKAEAAATAKVVLLQPHIARRCAKPALSATPPWTPRALAGLLRHPPVFP